MTAKGQRVHRGSIRTATVVAALLVTAGCTGKGDANPPTTSRTSAPVISQPAATPTPSTKISVPASMSPAETKAVGNAIEAYKQWVAAYDVLRRSGGKNVKPLQEFATQTTLASGQQAAALYATKGWHSIGSIEIREVRIERVSMAIDLDKDVLPEVALATCVDASNVDVLDPGGSSVITTRERVYTEQVWVRYFPPAKFPQVGRGANHWLVGQNRNQQVEEC